jgi:hypothetical protein
MNVAAIVTVAAFVVLILVARKHGWKGRTWLCLSVFLIALIGGCVSRDQTKDQVLVRDPGVRLLGDPKPVEAEARSHWQYAWLSVAAYSAVRNVEKEPEDCRSEKILGRLDWHRWPGFPGDGLKAKIEESNLRVAVWEHDSAKRIVVAFGGTVFNSGKDWLSNFRWFIPKHQDEYTLVVGDVGRAFVEEYKRRYSDKEPRQIHATGHSLGGGLAQQFAYSLPKDPNVPRVEHVFAFDPSPVTGYYSVEEALRDSNAEHLRTDRIFERGEVLAIVRSLQSLVFPPASSKPVIREVRYALFWSSPFDPIGGHSINRLATEITRASKEAAALAAVATCGAAE